MFTKFRRWATFTVVFGGGVLLLSGQWTSPIMLALVAGMSALVLYAMLTIESDLANERFRPPTRGEDPVALLFIRLTALGVLILAPLDSGRFHWTTAPPDGIRIAALTGALAAFLLCFRAMVVNRYFSAVIRIQSDRGHRVVDSGPYAWIRHPGYAGMALGVPLVAIALGSWLGFVVALAYSTIIVRRVAKEDRFLHGNLAGYPDYAARTRFRLLPGIW